MKLYKNGRCMQMVDKDQLDICLEAGWSRTDEAAEKEALKVAEAASAKALIDAKALLKAEEAPATPAPKKTVKIKPLKKQ
jgi:hypothetical protein